MPFGDRGHGVAKSGRFGKDRTAGHHVPDAAIDDFEPRLNGGNETGNGTYEAAETTFAVVVNGSFVEVTIRKPRFGHRA